MAVEKILACVGLNDFDRTRLRLLLGAADEKLQVKWRMGALSRADLLIIAPELPGAKAAVLNARERGVRCVNLAAVGDMGDECLPAAFDVDDLVAVLTSAGSMVEGLQSLDMRSPEIFDVQAAPVPDAVDDIPEEGELERFLHRDSGEFTLDNIVPHTLQETTVEPVQPGHVSTRAQVRSSERMPFDPSGSAFEPSLGVNVVRDMRTPVRDESEAHPLSAYLADRRLMAPSQIVLEGSEPLILDPKNSTYMITGDLQSAEPYAAARIRESEFARLSTRELERWRALCEPQPYFRLQWLVALCNGDGWLPSYLDPGGSYHLQHRFDPGARFDAQIRIGQVLQSWRHLHEVAAEACVDMQCVFNTVTAFDAIGWLQWRPRERFR